MSKERVEKLLLQKENIRLFRIWINTFTSREWGGRNYSNVLHLRYNSLRMGGKCVYH